MDISQHAKLLQEENDKLKKALENIAKTPLWGEPVADKKLKAEFIDTAQWDALDDIFNPSADTESSYLRECVEEARGALGLPFTVEPPEPEPEPVAPTKPIKRHLPTNPTTILTMNPKALNDK